MGQGYARPPISEAVIEFRYGGAAKGGALDRVTKRLIKTYPHIEDLQEVEVTVTSSAAYQRPGDFVLRRFISADGADIVLLNSDRIVVSRLAPYSGWDAFLARFKEVLRTSGRLFSDRRLARLAIRFVNRIDVPCEDPVLFDHRPYIALDLTPLPFKHGPMGALGGSFSTVLEGGRFGLVVNFGKVAAPIPGHGGVLLDIEVFNQAAELMPSDDDEIWTQVEALREWKSMIFESLITDKARNLFS